MTIPLLVHLTCKAALNTICSVSVHGLPHLEAALSGARTNGLLTRNFIFALIPSSPLTPAKLQITSQRFLDDPLAWGALPTKYFLSSRTIRWTLGAQDIMFTNPLFSYFFRKGQVLETVRGIGIYQPSVDAAIDKLNNGNWVHFFSEGKVNQPNTYSQRDGIAHLPRFKWGIGRVLMEASALPVIIPMWVTGFDSLMPEGRSFPYKYLPRPGKHLSITFGAPLDLEGLEALRTAPRSTEEIAQTRILITSALHRAVETLGRSISGDLLARTPE
ncbi:Tafazzin family protein [Mycena sanguinolenta]|uniref:Tafazzin family protein n=1 Tax=Mycena sanguinolenta TaxID=230812 RepID=A0A8H6Y874_9AGAR|nr:Tafazzin family protein [Mycena sanguinolenta]